MIYELKDPSKAEHLFAGLEDTLIRTCLQGMMDGKIYVTDPETPCAALAHLANFAIFAGEPDRELAAFKPKGLIGLIPSGERWEALIRECWPYVTPVTRYAIRKDTKFDRRKLEAVVSSLPPEYEVKRIDGELYHACLANPQFKDNVGNFASPEEFLRLGRGFAVLKDGKIVSVASSYSVYREGIEIEIDTEKAYRHKGLASAAGAALILSCLDDGLYPSWDAANLISLRLSEKLGYEFSHEYPTYWLREFFDRLIPDPDKSEWNTFCGRYRHPDDERRIYEICMKDGALYCHFVVPETEKVCDYRMYPIGEKTFGVNEDIFQLIFSRDGLTIGGTVCGKMN